MSIPPESAPDDRGEIRAHRGGIDPSEPDAFARRLIASDEQVLRELWDTQGAAAVCWLAEQFPGLRPFEREDVVQDALVHLWHARSRVDPVRNLVAYFHAIVRNAALDRLKTAWHRQSRREISVATHWLAAVVDASGGYESRAAEHESKPRATLVVRRLMDRLSEVQRAILWADACAPEGSACSRDLAQELGMTASRIRTERHRAIRKLRLASGCRPPPPAGARAG